MGERRRERRRLISIPRMDAPAIRAKRVDYARAAGAGDLLDRLHLGIGGAENEVGDKHGQSLTMRGAVGV